MSCVGLLRYIEYLLIRRLHSSLDYKTPAAVEQEYLDSGIAPVSTRPGKALIRRSGPCPSARSEPDAGNVRSHRKLTETRPGMLQVLFRALDHVSS